MPCAGTESRVVFLGMNVALHKFYIGVIACLVFCVSAVTRKTPEPDEHESNAI